MSDSSDKLVRHNIGIDGHTHKMLLTIGKMMITPGVKPPSFNSVISKLCTDYIKDHPEDHQTRYSGDQ